ncbi:hypothetical protein V3C99_011674, partial [Haemonchus contortus]
MSWKEEFSELLEFLDDCTKKYPSRLFNVTPETDSTPVRRVAFALENVIDQLKTPLVPSTQSLAQALVYKFNGPHRRQGYWMIYKNLTRALRKYNEDDLVTRVSDLHRKATASGAGFHMPSLEAMRYIGGAYLKRLFRLQQIRDLCIRTAHVIMGQLELGHWEKFSLFIVALCADVNNGVRMQATSMEPAYNGLSNCLRLLDDRFPDSLADISIFPSLRGHISAQKNADMSRVMRLLQITDEELEAVRTRDQMVRFRDEILSNMDSKMEDFGVSINRTLEMADRVNSGAHTFVADTIRKPSSTDSGLKLTFETSLVHATSKDTYDTEQGMCEEKEDKVLTKLAKKKRKRKRGLNVNQQCVARFSDPDINSSAIGAYSEESSGVRKKKKKKKKHHNAADISLSSHISNVSSAGSFSTPSAEIEKKKKTTKKIISDNAYDTKFDVAEDISASNNLYLVESAKSSESSTDFSHLLSEKNIIKRKKRTSKKKSITREKLPSAGQISLEKDFPSSFSFSTELSVGKKKKKRINSMKKDPLIDTNHKDKCDVLGEASPAQLSCFKTPKKLKRKLLNGEFDSPEKRRSAGVKDVSSAKKVRKKQKRKQQ